MIAAFGHGAGRLLPREVGVAIGAATTDTANLPRFGLGNMSMAIAGRAPSGDNASRGVRSGAGGLGALSALAPRLLSLSVLSLTMALAGCAQHSAQHEVKADPVEAAAPPLFLPCYGVH